MTDSIENAACGERLVLIAADGHRIAVDVWRPETPARAVVQVLHGLVEHMGRYERFARACNEHGFTVVAHNHRGHGVTCEADNLGHLSDGEGWSRLIDDTLQVQDNALRQFPDIPLILLGHSMGSYVAQCAVMRRPEREIHAMMLSGTTLPSRLQLMFGRMLARLERRRIGPRGKSRLLNRMGFGDFNEAFAPNRTEFDWLSRDTDEVDNYVGDPLCGGPATCQSWFDLTGGLLEISTRRALAKVPRDLPVLIVGGESDPAGGEKGLTALAEAYAKAGIKEIALIIYPGGRHEMLNESNRDQVTFDLMSWIDSTL